MIKEIISNLIVKRLGELQSKGVLVADMAHKVEVERPRDVLHGDYSVNIAMKLAKFGNPMDIANNIVKNIPSNQFLERIEVVSPGFINFYLSERSLSQSLAEIIKKDSSYGKLQIGKGKRVNVEYLSANPTGPLTVGNARGIFGNVLANVLLKAGYEVEREFYFNDIGGQSAKFSQTLIYWFKKELGETAEFPEGGYPGVFYKYLSKKVVRIFGAQKIGSLNPQELQEAFRKEGMKLMMDILKETVKDLNINFDKWISQQDVQADFSPKAFEVIAQNGCTMEKDGAVWFAPKGEIFEEDRESVLKKSDQAGTYTYFMDDIGYLWDKLVNRNFDLAIITLGPDHYGHIARMKNAAQALGIDPARLQIILYQHVRLKKNGEIVKMGKRTGNVVTAKELLSSIPADVFKFFLLMRAAESHLDFDFELAKDTSDKNPLYYVQYALARLHGIMRQSKLDFLDADLSLLKEPEEKEVIKQLILFPEIIEDIAGNYQVHRLTYYVLDLAGKLHAFYDKHRVLGDNAEITKVRLVLIKASIIVMTEALKVIGVSAPERM